MKPNEILNQQGAILIKDVLNKELCAFLSHCLMRSSLYKNGIQDDDQVQGSLGILDHEVTFETAHEKIWPALELVLEEELIPTYSYARLYTNGNVLEKHTDRPSCEVSVTVQLARSHHYAWPIYMGNQRFDLGEGDGVIYKGCDIEHWRDKCDGPENYVSGQAFFHFVKKKGNNAEWKNDKRIIQNFYMRNRNYIFEGK
ncbi:hypothetical protein UFOVP405_51 [uncultured Caudovirales phage]|uniref:Uncharacterized protein n=1 Tax=uncultured Caudovirales phage TaxID=2100421 RepID=A0A6J5M1B0_9CAUD|nr:hypothetical protein UFOVP405_51 [uncultured Caudovirales phage]